MSESDNSGNNVKWEYSQQPYKVMVVYRRQIQTVLNNYELVEPYTKEYEIVTKSSKRITITHTDNLILFKHFKADFSGSLQAQILLLGENNYAVDYAIYLKEGFNKGRIEKSSLKEYFDAIIDLVENM